ncbi:hypothetical protein [Mesorhizobium sp. B2-4-12]|uniref:hypothetical protein n=1 Tax=Mesorhizobium sp. B2-4-12 TaxID=2589937 RepID=UPI001AEE09EE|nr:hypothetical protein [Mesorhizobium sp. B2-4-12]
MLNALVAIGEMIPRDGNRGPALPHAKVLATPKARGAVAGWTGLPTHAAQAAR